MFRNKIEFDATASYRSKKIRYYVDLAEDKKETDMNTSVNSRDLQLDRALDYESRGQGFGSSRARHFTIYNFRLFIIKYHDILFLTKRPSRRIGGENEKK